MAKDYKDNGKRNGGGTPGIVWLIGGFALGVATTVLFRVGVPRSRPVASAPSPVSAPSAAPATRFDFYGMLENFEVVVPGQIKQPAAPTTGAAGTTAPNATPVVWVLQIGAFRTEPEADRLRAQLALIGVEAKIQKNVVDEKETWFRVRVGPLRDEAEVARLRERLDENHIKFLLLRAAA